MLSGGTRPNRTAPLTIRMPRSGRNMYRTTNIPIMMPKWTLPPLRPKKTFNVTVEYFDY